MPFDHLAAERALAAGADLSLGDCPGQTRVLCASYHQDPAVAMPLLTLLPDVLHIPSRQVGPALDTTLRLLAGEISRPEAGAGAALITTIGGISCLNIRCPAPLRQSPGPAAARQGRARRS